MSTFLNGSKNIKTVQDLDTFIDKTKPATEESILYDLIR
jgi:hypothetical protein